MLRLTGVRQAKAYTLVAAGFVLLALPLAIWLVAVPRSLRGFRRAYRDTGADVVHSPWGFFQLTLMKERWSVYSSFFEVVVPVQSSRGPRDQLDLRERRVFSKRWPCCCRSAAITSVRNRRTVFTMLVLAVFFCAPLAASLVNERHTIDRAMVLVPAGSADCRVWPRLVARAAPPCRGSPGRAEPCAPD